VQEAYVKIEVEDNGCGIAEDVREHIFDAFYTTKDTGEGTGLGLSIVRDIVQEHGGLIHAESAVGVGTKFTVLLPINQKIEQPLAA
jgi:signal transduction histidine kinase